MRILTSLLFFVASYVMAYEVSITQNGKFLLQIDGEIQEEKYTRHNDAVDAAIEIGLQCGECDVRVVSPTMSVTAKEITPPIEPPPIDPPIIDPPPVDPPPTDALAAYYSLELYNGELVNPKLLGDAVLPPQDVYIEWRGNDISRVNGYCCKPTGGQHHENDIKKTGNTTFTLKLARHAGETKKLELYSDVWAGGEPFRPIYTFFNVDHTIDPPPIGDDITFDWDMPKQRTDDTELKRDEIGGYVVSVSSMESNSKTVLFNTTETEFVLDTGILHPADWAVRVAAFDTTPSRECPEKDIVPYSCGGPLRSDFSNFIKVVVE